MLGCTLWYLSNHDSTKESSLAHNDTHIAIPSESSHSKEVASNIDFVAKEVSKNNPKIPLKVIYTLVYIREYNEAPKGYKGGQQFFNREKLLPQKSKEGKPIKYREWDVHPLVKGKNRGAERLVTSQKSAYYTDDHYRSFTQIEE